jgi:Ser/Thr protein kinase RdoA (MazF antagonist)
MDESIRQSFTPAIRRQIFARAGLKDESYVDLDGFENIVLGNGEVVARITHCSHRDREALLAELEFVSFLAANGCAVCRPRLLPDESLLVSEGAFFVCLFEQAQGTPMQANDWNTKCIWNWGASIGQFHQVASGFKPNHSRMHWRDDPNHDFAQRIPSSMTTALSIGQELLCRLETLSTDPEHFGLIHGDAHPGNFLVVDQMPTFFDFDDAINVWYAYDIATICFSAILRQDVTTTRSEQASAARKFIGVFLEGYASRASVTEFMLAEMQTFLKLRELSLFAVIHRFLDLAHLDEFPAKFMVNRQQLIESGAPVIDIDFGAL